MSLNNKIRINTHYTRSINLERDASSNSVIEAYIPTSRAFRTFERVADALLAEQSPRAWSLVGPYGAGKSSFAVFLSHLLSSQNNKSARRILEKSQTGGDLAKKYAALTGKHSGYCIILLTGNPESLGRGLVRVLLDKLNTIRHETSKTFAPEIYQKLITLLERPEPPVTIEVMRVMTALQNHLAQHGYTGLLLVVDELGKFLEYEARHHGSDIYLLQSLAEHSGASHPVKFAVVVMLHQSFDQYAKNLGESHKNEWAKVQGRFENIPFLESSEQTLRIVSAAIKHHFDADETRQIAEQSRHFANLFAHANALPSAMTESEAAELFQTCYPLHPVSALALPRLCQKIAQNERTLFSYLGSRESFGFQDALKRIQHIGDWIYPWEIYEYFILNQPAAISDHFTHRRWVEVVTAVERLGDAPPEQTQLLKTIGLLNIIGAQGNFKASQELVAICQPQKQTGENTIQKLIERSVIHYRKYSSEYRVWQGSDFDLEASIVLESERLGVFSIAEQLNARNILLPIVARRYTIESGTLRYFVPQFIDANNFKNINTATHAARIIFYLAENQNDEIIFRTQIVGRFSSLDVVVLYRNTSSLRGRLTESLALEAVQKNAQALHTDPVAKREFLDQYAAAISHEEECINSLIDEPHLGEWFHQAEVLNVPNKRALQTIFSTVLKQAYHLSPIIQNELINRDKPSSQANAAKNKLVMAMLHNAQQEELGFEKSPPEKAIYAALLRTSKLHTIGFDGQWHFAGPTSPKLVDDPCQFFGVWERIEQFFAETEHHPKSLIELNKELMAPPYGLKEGVLQILYVTAILANQDELAIYENRVYKPRFTEDMLEHFIKRPDEFTFQRFRLDGLNAAIFAEYSRALFSDGRHAKLLEVAKPLANFISKLPEYTLKTNRTLSKPAQTVRDAIRLSKSPVQLLTVDIPAALGYNTNATQNSQQHVLSEALRNTIRELKRCFDKMKQEMQELCAQALHLDKATSLSDLCKTAYGRYKGLEQYTIDKDGQRAFIQRLIQQHDEDGEWFNNLLAFLGQKSIEKWTDTERDLAEYRLAVFSHKLDDLEKLRIQFQAHGNQPDSNFDVYLLRSVKKGAMDYDEVVVVDNHRHNHIQDATTEINQILSKLGNELSIAALAEVVDAFLVQRNQNKQVQPTAAPKPKKLIAGG